MTYPTVQNAERPSLLAGITNADLAATILRVSMGVMFLAHAWLKLVIFTPAGTVGFFESQMKAAAGNSPHSGPWP